jgi:WD40 repeat protein
VITTIGTVALALAVLAGVLGWASYRNELRAEREQRASAARELASASLTSLSTDPELGTLLALQAIATTKSKDGIVLPEAIDALYRAVGTPHAQLTLKGQGAMDRITYSPDGKLLAAYDAGGFRRIWNTTTGQELFSLPATSEIPFDLTFTQDGQTLVTTDLDETGHVAVSFWDVKSGTLRSTTPLPVNAARLSADELSANGSLLALADQAGETIIWDTGTGQEIRKFSQSNAVSAVAFSRDGARIATADRNEVMVWDITSGKEVLTFSKPNQLIASIEFSPDGTRLAASNYYSLIWVWDLRTGEELFTLYGHTNTVNSVHFSADSMRIASASYDRKVILWDAVSGAQLLSLAGHTNTVWDAAFSPDGKHIASASEDHSVKIWDAGSGRELPSVNTGALITIFDSGQKHIALSFSDRPAEIWDFSNKRKLFSLSNHSISWVYRFSADGKRLASKSPDGTVSLWDATDGKELWSIRASPVGMVIPSPDGRRVAIAYDIGDDRGWAEIWDVENNKRLLSLSGHKAGVWGLAYSPDGKRIATGDNAGIVKVWDAETGKELLTLEHSLGSKIRALTFSPDGKYLASGSQNGLGKVWDSASGKLVITLSGHTSTLKDFAFSPDGTRIATAGYDGTLRIWDVRSGTQMQTLYGDGGGFWTLAYTPDGKRLVAATDSGLIRTYLMDIDELITLAEAGSTRQLSEQECQQYLHSKPCPAFP